MPRRTSKTHCIACRKLIRGKPNVMKLQITHAEPRLIERAKKLGFASASWQVGDFMQGPLHKACFKLATLVWQIAFDTRALSPRR